MALGLLATTARAQTVTSEEQQSAANAPPSDADRTTGTEPMPTEPADLPATPPSAPASATEPMPPVDLPDPEDEKQRSRFVARAFVGVGFAGYEGRNGADAEDTIFAASMGSVAAGVVLLQRPAGTLGLSAEALVGRSLSASRGGRAAGNWLGGGLTLSAYFTRWEVALGGYLLARPSEARDLALTESRLNGAIGAAFFRDFRVTPSLSLGAGVKVLLLPTQTYDDAYGKKHLRLSDGAGTVGLSASWR